MNALASRIEWLFDRLGGLLLLAAAVLIGGEFAIVALRYGLDWSRPWLQEVVLAANAVVFLLGAGYTLRHDGHVRIDIWSRQRSARTQALLELLGLALFLLPFALFLLWSGLPYAWRSWQIGEGSGQQGGLPAVWLVKSLIPLSAVLLLLAGSAAMLRAIERWRRAAVDPA